MLVLIWRIASWFFLIWKKIVIPQNTLVFDKMPPKESLERLIKSFQKVYYEFPWNENWPAEKVKKKLKEELKDGELVILEQSEEVKGFAWGAIVNPSMVIDRVIASFPGDINKEETQKQMDLLMGRLPQKFFYWDEIGLLSNARGGLESIRRLILPLLQFANRKRAKSILFRTTSGSKIIRLAQLMGFKIVFRRQLGGRIKEIYLFLSDLQPLLTLAERADSHLVAKLMILLSSFSKAKG